MKNAELKATETEQKIQLIKERIFDRYNNAIPEKLIVDNSEEQLEMLQYFKKFAITSTIYDNKNPWTLLEAQGQEDNATHKIYKENFQMRKKKNLNYYN